MSHYGSYNIISPEDAMHEMRNRDARMNHYDSQTGACLRCGCSMQHENRAQHNNWHATFIHRSEVNGGFAVSHVKWCDVGNHAFKATAPGAQQLDVMQRDENGVEKRVQMDICGDHAFPTGIPSPDPKMPMVEAAYNEENRSA